MRTCRAVVSMCGCMSANTQVSFKVISINIVGSAGINSIKNIIFRYSIDVKREIKTDALLQFALPVPKLQFLDKLLVRIDFFCTIFVIIQNGNIFGIKL